MFVVPISVYVYRPAAARSPRLSVAYSGTMGDAPPPVISDSFVIPGRPSASSRFAVDVQAISPVRTSSVDTPPSRPNRMSVSNLSPTMIVRVRSKSCLQTARSVSDVPPPPARLTLPGRSPASSWMVSQWTKGLSRARTEEERSLSPLPAKGQTRQGTCCLHLLPGRRILRSWSGTEMPLRVSCSLCSYQARRGLPRPTDLA